MALKINTTAPDFKLPSTEGKVFQLSKDAKKQSLILYFYPKDFTRGCTKEACEFRDQFEIFRNLDVLVYGISTDSIEKHHKFRKHHQLPFHLLADEDAHVSKLYAAKMPLVKISKRVTYLLDSDHNIKAAFQDLFGAENHIKSMIKEM